MRPTRTTSIALTAAAAVALSGISWAAGLTVSSQRLTAATLAAPPFFPTGVSVVTNAKGGAAPDQKDVITVGFNRALSAASVCAMTADVDVAGFTITITDGGAVNDTLTVTAGPAGCSSPRIGTFDLGTSGYVTGGSATSTGSTLRVVTSPPSLQIALGTRPAPKLNDVAGVTTVRFVPHPLLTDRSAQANRVRGTAADSVQF